MKNFVLVGPGLSGTNLMRRCLEKIGMQRLTIGRHPHTRNVPKDSPCNVLYIYADPRNALLCAVNRTVKNSKLIQKYGQLKVTDLPLWNHCNAGDGDTKFVQQNAGNINIEFVLDVKYDPMKLEEHFTNWLTADINYNLMMLKYEALVNPKTYQEVLKFFNVEGPQEEWSPRKTSYLNLPVKQQIQITELFKNLLKKQAEIPLIHIRDH
jgi:hypothetical protein